MTSFKKNLLQGLKWTTLSTILRNIVRLLQIAVLTRVLAKEDFGTIAIASLFIGFTDLFMDMGLSSAILHKQHITKKEYSSLFWFNIISGLLLTALLWTLSPLCCYIYNDDELLWIIRLLSLNVLFSSLGRQMMTVKQKKLEFKYIACIELLASIITMFTAIYCALHEFGVYSLVCSSLIGVLIPNLIYLVDGIIKSNQISFHFSYNETIPFLKIGIYQIGSSILDYLSRELDIIILGFLMSKESIGIYTLCKGIITTAYGIVNPIITKVLTPLLACIQNNIEEIRNKYLTIISILSLINYPIYIFIGSCSTCILYILYGSEYIEANITMLFLAINYGILSIANPVGSLQIALGRTDIGFKWTIFRFITSPIFISLGAAHSLEGLAIATLTCTIFSIIPFWAIQLKPLINISLLIYIKKQISSFIYSLLLTSPYLIFLFSNTSVLLSALYGTLYILTYALITKKAFNSLSNKMSDS